MSPSAAADKALGDWLDPPDRKEREIVAVRVLQPLQAQGLPVPVGALIGTPVDWGAHLIESGLAERAPLPEQPWDIDEIDCRFCRNFTDVELAQILERKVEHIPDPDYPQEKTTRETFSLKFGSVGPARPATMEEVAAYRKFHKIGSIENRLEVARRSIRLITGTPEHADAEKWLEKAGDLWCQVQDKGLPRGVRIAAGDRVQDALEHLFVVGQAGLRRIDVRPILQRDARRQGGTRKPRRPKIDNWIEQRVIKDPSATRGELWDAAPEWITDQIGRDRFLKRVSQVRKRVASK